MEDVVAREQRAIRRFAVQLPVKVTSKSGEAVGGLASATRDVSSQGICFFCDFELEQDSTIEFTLTLPMEVTMSDPLTVRCRGKVVRVERGENEGPYAIAAAISNYEFVADGKSEAPDAGNDNPPTL